MATQKTLYLTTDGIYHTDQELAQEAQDRLNSTGGKSEAIKDLDAYIAQATAINDSKYWGELYAQSISNTSKFRNTDGVDMFRDIFDNDFEGIVSLALSIAAHRYTLPVSVDWQAEDDAAKAHLSGDNFNYSLAGRDSEQFILTWNDQGFLYTNNQKFNYSITTEVAENTFGFRAGNGAEGELLATFTYDAEGEVFNPFTYEEITYQLTFSAKSLMFDVPAAAQFIAEPG